MRCENCDQPVGLVHNCPRKPKKGFTWAVILVLVGVVIWGISKADASDIESAIQSHMEWVAERTDYSADVALPEVVYATYEEMLIIRHGEGNHEFVMPSEAVYDPYAKVMFLPKGFDSDDPETAFTLLHEVVHHMQAMHGVHDEVPCLANLEEEAYALQREYVEETGIGHLPDELTVKIISMCPWNLY